MRIMTLNLNGIRAAYGKGLASFLSNTQPDIVCLQELKAHEADIPALASAYHSEYHCAERKGYSGVGILSKVKPISTKSGMGIKTYDAEARVLQADFADITVLSVYVPSGSSASLRQVFKMRFLKRFKRHISMLLAEDRELIICGDMNIAHTKIDLYNWQSNQKNSGFLPEERAWLDAFLKLGLVDVFRNVVGPDIAAYSWWSLRTNARARDVGWRLDYQFATPKLAAKASWVDIPKDPVLSDHAPVIIDYAI